MINVKVFGATGNGSTFDDAAIQSAINSLAISGGGVVYFPPGNYKIDNPLSIAVPGISLVGGSSTEGVTITLATSAIDGIYIFGPYFKMSNIFLSGVKDTTNTTLLTLFKGADNCLIESCRFVYAYNNIKIASCSNIIIKECSFNDITDNDGTDNNYHILFSGASYAQSSGLTIRDCQIASGTGATGAPSTTAIQLNEYTDTLFVESGVVNGGFNGFVATIVTPGGTAPRNLQFVGFGTDQIDGPSMRLDYAQDVRIEGCKF
jgi:polygalacturonase